MQNLLLKAMMFCVRRLRNDRYRPKADAEVAAISRDGAWKRVLLY